MTLVIVNEGMVFNGALLPTEWGQYAQIDWLGIATVLRPPALVSDVPSKANAAPALSAGPSVWRVGEG